MLVSIDSRATRSHDAIIKIDVVEIFFKDGNIKITVPNYIRNQNKDIIADVENVISSYIGEKITKTSLNEMAQELKGPISQLVKK